MFTLRLALAGLLLGCALSPAFAQTLTGESLRPQTNAFKVTAQIANEGSYQLQQSTGSFTRWLSITNFNSLPGTFVYKEPFNGARKYFRIMRHTMPPTILTHPAGSTNYSGQNVRLESSATGSWPLRLQWYRNAKPIPGATSSVLTFTAKPELSGTYNLLASNLWGMVISSNAVVLNRNPVLTNISGKTLSFVIQGAQGDFVSNGTFEMTFDPRGSFSTAASSVFLNDRGNWQYGVVSENTSVIYMQTSFVYPGGSITLGFQTLTNGTYTLVAPGRSGGQVGKFTVP